MGESVTRFLLSSPTILPQKDNGLKQKTAEVYFYGFKKVVDL
jgi:hypothetical protein